MESCAAVAAEPFVFNKGTSTAPAHLSESGSSAPARSNTPSTSSCSYFRENSNAVAPLPSLPSTGAPAANKASTASTLPSAAARCKGDSPLRASTTPAAIALADAAIAWLSSSMLPVAIAPLRSSAACWRGQWEAQIAARGSSRSLPEERSSEASSLLRTTPYSKAQE